MGRSNPLKPISDILEGTVRAIKDNPEKAFLTSTPSPSSLIYAGYEGVKQMGKDAQKSAQKQVIGAQKDAAASAAQDVLTANESVAAQKEKARKKTVFGGSTDANLFNKSLIGASTTSASGTIRSILGV